RARPISELRRRLDENTLDWRTLPEGAEFSGAGRTGKKIKPARSQSWDMLGKAMKRQVIDSQRLAYLADVQVNWCPALGTVLSNEEVDNQGRSDRGGHPVFRRPLRQWMLRITKYADRLLSDLDTLNWPESIKLMQRNWIGKSTGAEVAFPLAASFRREADGWYDVNDKKVSGADVYQHADTIQVYTTRPDTLYGATYMVLAPEHPLVDKLVQQPQAASVAAYIARANAQTELDRISQGQVKTGEFTGGFAINPFTGQKVPVWIADYVLYSYGTGAIMAVPGSDERDFEFATLFNLPITEVVSSDGQTHDAPVCYTGKGIAVNSGEYTGMTTDEATERMTDEIERRGIGERTVQYKVRDWCISRQRYWGAPIPIIHCPDCGEVPVPDSDLPVKLPENFDLAAALGQDIAPLATSSEFMDVPCPNCGHDARRDTDTMDTFVDSSWYYLRYPDSGNPDVAFTPERLKTWLPVDMYIGGIDHAVMHLFYARFFVKALRDGGLLDFDEPFLRLYHQGIITKGGARMSKSKGNTVSPDPFVEQYGSDVFRTYLMFMGPYDEGGDWSDSGITGISRFQKRIWQLLQQPVSADAAAGPQQLRLLHRTIRDVSRDLEQLRFNTAIAHLMELSNGLTGAGPLSSEVRDGFIQLIAPLMPHMAEELWELAGQTESIFASTWPGFDPKLCEDDHVTMAVTVNGKRRAELVVPVDISEADLLQQAKAIPAVVSHIAGKNVIKEIVVPGRLVNIVIK
ncbi:MAG: leucine--tRNA ligase, partial [Candidatus Marinimicrobia bacterium]|nr:leucine--tRNA ligase [Candidatus Neomarinimicrobiota bacterium]